MTAYLIDEEVLKQVLDAMESVLCNPAGKCCIHGSKSDRLVVDTELDHIRTILSAPPSAPFQIFNPTSPIGKVNVRDGDLPWVYDQDPSSGFKASMWVVPVNRKDTK